MELQWADVQKVHGTVAGIGFRDRRVTSILFNQGKAGPYPDRLDGEVLVYHVGPSTQPHCVRYLLSTVGTGARIRVFEKLAVGRWRDHGLWTPAEVGEQSRDGFVQVTFHRA